MIRTIYHRHKGVTSNGKLKSHPVTIKHKDINAQRHHNLITEKVPILLRGQPKFAKHCNWKKLNGEDWSYTNTKKAATTIDDDGYIMVDLTNISPNIKGVRIQFQRTENNKKRLIGLQIEK